MGKQLVALGLLFILGCASADRDPPAVEAPLGPCAPTGRTLTIEGVEFVEIGPGSFLMGDASVESEGPVHEVEFAHGFWIATTEITNAQYERFKPENQRSEYSRGDDSPVIEMSWHEAKEYCAWLSEKSGRPIRLPSEAEWECACRAGSDTEFAFGDDEENLSEYAWFGEDVGSGARAVGSKRPNRWGLYDLHGNVWEWCEDTWHASYDEAPTDGAPWVDEGTPIRVYRGGGWVNPAWNCRSAYRFWFVPAIRGRDLGFRPAFVLEDD